MSPGHDVGLPGAGQNPHTAQGRGDERLRLVSRAPITARISEGVSQIAAPFTPVPGPRLLLRDPAMAPALIGAIEALTDQNGLSSAHAGLVCGNSFKTNPPEALLRRIISFAIAARLMPSCSPSPPPP